MLAPDKRVERVWDTEVPWDSFFWSLEPVRQYINRRISGDPAMDWLEYVIRSFLQNDMPLDRCLSLCCGRGHVERALAERHAFIACDAVDISEESLTTARRLAQEAGCDHVRYRRHDVNTLALDGDAYAAVFVNSGLHHVHNLEGVYRQVRHGLKANGWFILNEYVGPSRFQFTDRQLEVMNAVLRLLPAEYRRSVRSHRQAVGGTDPTVKLAASPRRLAYKVVDLAWRGELLVWAADRLAAWLQRRRGQPVYKRRVFRPTPKEIAMWDPSEAVRSAEILPLLHEFFEVVEVRPWGGTVFNFVLDDIAANFDPQRAPDVGLLNLVLSAERELIDCGDLHSDFALVVARKAEA